MIDITDLKPGDILVVLHNGKPYHVAIYAPTADRIGDVIHAGSGFKRSGVTRGTLAHLYHLHHGMNDAGNFFKRGPESTLDIRVFRSKEMPGEAIADQAEQWLLQGVVYDEKRLADTLEANEEEYDITDDMQIHHLFEYLKYAARRETAPIKTPYFPNPGASVSSVLGSFCAAPSLNLPQSLAQLGLSLMKNGTQYEGRPKGFSCAGFVLACLGAVALQGEIAAVSPESGWVSLKYGQAPQDDSTPYAKAWQTMKSGLTEPRHEASQPGLDTLMSEEQLQNFDPDRLIQKLSFLANLHPHKPSIQAFMEGIEDASTHWQSLGSLNKMELGPQKRALSKVFDKKEYQQEKIEDMETTRANHQQFGQDHAQTALREEVYPRFYSKKIISYLTGETVSDITGFRKTKKDIVLEILPNTTHVKPDDYILCLAESYKEPLKPKTKEGIKALLNLQEQYREKPEYSAYMDSIQNFTKEVIASLITADTLTEEEAQNQIHQDLSLAAHRYFTHRHLAARITCDVLLVLSGVGLLVLAFRKLSGNSFFLSQAKTEREEQFEQVIHSSLGPY